MTDWDWLGDDLALDLANTVRRRRDREVDLLDGPAALRAWLDREAGRVPAPDTVDGAALERFRALRDDALAVLRAAGRDAPLPAGAAAGVNAIARARPAVRLLGDRAGTTSTVVLHASDALDELLAVLAAAVVDLVARPGAGGIALCDAPSCGQLFLRGRADQLWCGPACGLRARAARHHARQRGASVRARAR
jgi:predicted RNA-binding Zn ribbon-like protein